MTSLDDILDKQVVDIYELSLVGKNSSHLREQTKQAIKDLLLELVSDYQKVTPTKYIHNDTDFYQKHYRPLERNKFRDELRKKIEEL